MNIEKSSIYEWTAEFFGTFIMITLGCGCVAAAVLTQATYGAWEIAIIWGFAVALAVYLTAGVSGAHLNPAVTLSLWLFGGFPAKKIIPYITAQFLGAFCAALLIYGLYYTLFINTEAMSLIIRGTPEALATAGVFATYPHPQLSTVQAFFVEFSIAAILLCLILALSDNKNGIPRGALGPLLIGILIAVIGGAFGPLTGFALNPARDFAPRLFTYFAGWGNVVFTGGKEIPYFLVPLIAPILGGFFGCFCYRNLIEKNFSSNS